ncbi:hypothetical protein LSAT2_029644 [Lamellibrachia satsuma]|nr:hypothetical protein LSAT2_029644 [Lamellibrachia satsuma]
MGEFKEATGKILVRSSDTTHFVRTLGIHGPKVRGDSKKSSKESRSSTIALEVQCARLTDVSIRYVAHQCMSQLWYGVTQMCFHVFVTSQCDVAKMEHTTCLRSGETDVPLYTLCLAAKKKEHLSRHRRSHFALYNSLTRAGQTEATQAVS